VNTCLAIPRWTYVHSAIFQIKKIFDLNTKNPQTEVCNQLLRRPLFDQIVGMSTLPPIELALLLLLSLRGEVLSLMDNLQALERFFQKTGQDAKIQPLHSLKDLLSYYKPLSTFSGTSTSLPFPSPPSPLPHYESPSLISPQGNPPLTHPGFYPQQMGYETGTHPPISLEMMNASLAYGGGTHTSIPQDPFANPGHLSPLLPHDLIQVTGLDTHIPSTNMLEMMERKKNLFEKIKKNPKDVEAYEELLNIFQMNREIQKPEAREIAIALAKLYIKSSSLEKLEPICLTFLDQDEDLFFRNTLINVYIDLNRKDDAVGIYRELLERLENPAEDLLLEYYNKMLKIDSTLTDIREKKEIILKQRSKRAQVKFTIRIVSILFIVVSLVASFWLYTSLTAARRIIESAKDLKPEKEIENLPKAKEIIQQLLQEFPAWYPASKEASSLVESWKALEKRHETYIQTSLDTADKTIKELREKWEHKLKQKSFSGEDEIQAFNNDVKNITVKMKSKEVQNIPELSKKYYDPFYQEINKEIEEWMNNLSTELDIEYRALLKTLKDNEGELKELLIISKKFEIFKDKVHKVREEMKAITASTVDSAKYINPLKNTWKNCENQIKELAPQIQKHYEEDIKGRQQPFEKSLFELSKFSKKPYSQRLEEKAKVEQMLTETRTIIEKHNIDSDWFKLAENRYKTLIKSWEIYENEAKTFLDSYLPRYQKALEELKNPNTEESGLNFIKTYLSQTTQHLLLDEQRRWTQSAFDLKLPLLLKVFPTPESSITNIDIYYSENGQKQKKGETPFLFEYQPVYLENFFPTFKDLNHIELGGGRILSLYKEGFSVTLPNESFIRAYKTNINSIDYLIPYQLEVQVDRQSLWIVQLPPIPSREKPIEPGVVEAEPYIDVENSILYIGTRSGIIYAYDYSIDQKPKLLWSKKLGSALLSGIKTPPVLVDKTLYVATTDGFIYSIDIESQNYERTKQRESDRFRSIISPPLLIRDRLYFVSQTGLFCIDKDLSKSEVLWHYSGNDKITPDFKVASYRLLYHEPYLIVLNNTPKNAELVFFDIRKPESPFKRLSLDAPSSSTPFLFENSLYIGDDSGKIYHVDLQNFALFSRVGRSKIMSAPLILKSDSQKELLLYATDSRSIIAHNPTSLKMNEPVAEVYLNAKHTKSPLALFNNTVYFGANDLLYALSNELDPQGKLKIKWKFGLAKKDEKENSNTIQAPVVFDSNKNLIFAVSNNAILYIFQVIP
jgi:outer membrane protein assembly factor BamB